MIVQHAHTVLPISGPPLPDGWVGIDQGRVIACGTGEAPDGRRGTPPFASDPFVILPALVNAHTHVELSYLRGAVPPGDRFDSWIRALVSRRREYRGTPATIDHEARAAIADARSFGTGLVGDVANTLITVPLFRELGVAARVFHELIGFKAPNPHEVVRQAREMLNDADESSSDVRVSLAPHAPYSVAPALFRAIRKDFDTTPGAISSVHLGESRDEVEFLSSGGGAIRAALDGLGAWDPQWIAPGCGPVEYLARVGMLHHRILVVHAVQLTDAELHQLKAAGVTIVTCPRSNRWTGAGSPPVERFYESGVRVAVGTDSLTSVEDLNVFNELAAIRALAPHVPAARILESATMIGAEGLGFGTEFGTIEPGKRATLIAVRVPADVTDVEEYLLTGIPPEDIRWLDCERTLGEP